MSCLLSGTFFIFTQIIFMNDIETREDILLIVKEF